MFSLQDEFAAIFPPRTVEELSKLHAGGIVLHVTRIKVIEKIEDPRAYASSYSPVADA